MSQVSASSAVLAEIERLYALADAGRWDHVLSALVGEHELAAHASRHRHPTLDASLLHLAARDGHEQAARAFVRLGSPLSARDARDRTPSDLAAEHGHLALAELLILAARAATELWVPSAHPFHLPSSSAWEQARERHAVRELRVAYGGGLRVIDAGAHHYVDAFDRVLIGWHGSYDPPLGMDGESMLEELGNR
jgi:hypothetical protein